MAAKKKATEEESGKETRMVKRPAMPGTSVDDKGRVQEVS